MVEQLFNTTPGPRLVDDHLASGQPFYVSRRGGARIHPEHTLKGYRDSATSGFMIQCDLRAISTGEIVCIHDATTTRTMTGTAADVSTLTLDAFRSRYVKSPWPGGNVSWPCTWLEVLTEFGGQTVIVAEIKDLAILDQVISDIKQRRLERAVILRTTDLDAAKQIAATKIAAMLMVGSTTTVTPEELTEGGIEFLGVEKTMLDATIETFRTAGVKVIMHAIGSRPDWYTYKNKPVDGAFFDDPWGALDRHIRNTRDPFHTSEPFYGWDYTNVEPGGETEQCITYQSPQGSLMLNALPTGPGGAGSKTMYQSWAQHKSTTEGYIRLTFTATYDDAGGTNNAPGTTRCLMVFLGVTPNNRAFRDVATPGQYGYMIVLRRNGTFDTYKINDNSTSGSAISSFATTPALSQTQRALSTDFEIVLGYTGIVIRRLDTGVGVTVNDNSYRTNLGLHLMVNGMVGRFSNISYEAITPSAIGW